MRPTRPGPGLGWPRGCEAWPLDSSPLSSDALRYNLNKNMALLTQIPSDQANQALSVPASQFSFSSAAFSGELKI